MNIRTITCFINPGWPLDVGAIQKAGGFLRTAREAVTATGYNVQSVRLATLPFPDLVVSGDADETIRFAREIETAAAEQGIDYIALGPAVPGKPRSYSLIPELIGATRNVFFSAKLGETRQISLPAVRACAEIITRSAGLSPDGFANLRFTAMANVPPGTPFFPAAYHTGRHPAFALATESADLAVTIFENSTNLEEARKDLIAEIEKHAHQLEAVCRDLSAQSRIRFGGIDFTLAPFPEEKRSLGAAFERLGVPMVGFSGSLSAAAILTDTLDQASFQRTGFCGLMLPVLEDSILAERAAQGSLTVNDLLLYSAVCGTGLDTVPLPGDTSSDQIAALLLDLASLAYRLDKPLTARLMPIPGKAAGDPISFDFAFFANSRVMPLAAAALKSPMANADTIQLRPRPIR